MKYNGAEMLGTLRTIATARTRSFHTSPRGSRIQGQLQRTKPPIPQRQVLRKQEVQQTRLQAQRRTTVSVKRNELGVQMLSRRLHAQIFKNVSFPAPDRSYVNIALQHLEQHGLDPSQGFTSHPGRTEWNIHQSGWTKYYYMPDGSSYSEAIDYPRKDDGSPEELLTFDVETLPNYHPYAIMACAASPSAWYAWVSPWLLNESEDPVQLIPLGDPGVPRVIGGQKEYHLDGTKNRISSNQRPAWMKWRKDRQAEKDMEEEARMAIPLLLQEIETLSMAPETTAEKREDLRKLKDRLEDSLVSRPSSHEIIEVAQGGEEDDVTVKTWESDDFMKLPPSAILASLPDYLSYCASDVQATHAVFVKVLPAFLAQCPHPVSFAGILSMGSSFLCVDEGWEKYLEQAEGVYMGLEKAVKTRLAELANEAMSLFLDDPGQEKWKDDVWLNQLDWTPKVAGKSRGVLPPDPVVKVGIEVFPVPSSSQLPSWYAHIRESPFSTRSIERILPLLLKLSYNGQPILWSSKEKWHYLAPSTQTITRFDTAAKNLKTNTVLCAKHALKSFDDGRMGSCDVDLATLISQGVRDDKLAKKIKSLADQDKWLEQLDWSLVTDNTVDPLAPKKRVKKQTPPKPPPVLWPKWIAPLLLKLSWLNWPLHSREHGWMFRVPASASFATRSSPLSFYDPADDTLAEASLRGGYLFYKLPHKDGEKANVGSPLGKTFMKYSKDGTLKSPGTEAMEALDMNAMCSYWISARDRILNQNVVWQDTAAERNLGFTDERENKKWGIILPQVITMGTVTRRAIEKTWLTARYAIVGADVDSEELWISSCMGDAQFGLHGATAIGWMTLEGTKAAGTDLHSKTASILGISRDQAKVFNYSRIYGAGMRHAILLLLQNSAGMLQDEAHKLATNLYASTKGKNTHRTDIFDRKFWFGGTESFLFNKLEEIAVSDKPQTPALGCGVTYALSKEYLPSDFGSDYMPSRINWVVQSSGVDYLHLLIVSMDYLIRKYNIHARYLISVHDELRYLVSDADRYRAALALQIANVWTRSLFAYKLGMDDLPQGVAFFSAVDVDRVLRKEVDMPCVTPSQPNPIPPGESLNIEVVLERTNGSLLKNGGPMSEATNEPFVGSLDGYTESDCLVHRAKGASFLQAQAASDFGEVKHLAQLEYGKKRREPQKEGRPGGEWGWDGLDILNDVHSPR
ncbi:DNA polymerase family A-domain-containing protein [Mycena galericulata]|nr:DNA polymerase family A-domain-containing protein [Mycena galericulata]